MSVKELFLFVRPPRATWPFNGPATAFWPPLAFATLGAALRENVRDIRVEILDCPALRMGWKTLSRELGKMRPAYVGIGEEAVSAAEGLRLARMARALGAKVIAGGCTFGNLAPEVLATGLIDVVVHGEGERTVVEVVEALRCTDAETALSGVRGVSFRRGGQVLRTTARPLIENLDDLPMPAWDLVPMERYGKGSLNHPDLATIEHSRGCVGSCGFCVLWRQMGRAAGDGVRACYRTKSIERVTEEMRILRERYGRRYLCWVDPCFNADGEWLGEFAERMVRQGAHIGQNAWVRADFLERDEASGVVEKLVRCGLNEIFVGVERADAAELGRLGRAQDGDAARRILPVLAARYPSLYIVGSFIYGLPGDDWRTVIAMRDATIEMKLDTAFYIPLTGLPGTDFWDSAAWDGTGETLRGMNFLTAAGPNGRDVRRLTREFAASYLLDMRPKRIRYVLEGLFAKDARKRRMNRRLLWRGAVFAARGVAHAATGNGAWAMRRPEWYED